jgi:adenosine deaminase
MTTNRYFLKKYALNLLLLLVLLPACSLLNKKDHPKTLHEFAHLMPKPELHVHLEGSINPKTILDIAQKNNITLPFTNENEFRTACVFSSFEQFVTLYKKIIGCLKTPQDYERISYEFGKECARQNIAYAEVIFSMATNCMNSGLDWQTILTALNNGKAKAQEEFGISWNWIFDLSRTKFFEPEDFVNRIITSRDSGQNVVALGFSETLIAHKVTEYQNIFDKALAAKLPIIPHAGEFEGPVSIWNAINVCKSTRIHHGVRAIEDAQLIAKLKQTQTALDICITSNVQLGVFPSYQQHSIRKLWDAGLFITISTDDPSLFNTDLNKEYDRLIDEYHFTIDELERVSLNGIQASFLSPENKKTLLEKFKSKFALLRGNIF